MMRWSKGLVIGLSGTSLALAVGCSHPKEDAAQDTQEVTVTAAAEEKKDDTWTNKSTLEKPADKPVEISQNQPGGSNWFLRPPGAPDPNTTPASNQTEVNSIKSPTPAPTQTARIVQTQQQVRPKNQQPNWRMAACGRG
jgi:hypothetical protein